AEHEPIDHKIDITKAVHVVDADSSQAVVIEEVLRGRSLVVQGPPGTGKSQTITNVIAAAVGGVAGLVGIEGGVVSGVINLESSGVEAPDWRPRHDERYHEV
ncbi:MAG TPA: AAA domain-containing protein, partial [Vicinamibacterales bacterium]|nr:AAA domain-containing protein [Vicinamibacterales bacterium]